MAAPPPTSLRLCSQAYLDAVAAGRVTVPIHRTYALEGIAQAHADMEDGGRWASSSFSGLQAASTAGGPYLIGAFAVCQTWSAGMLCEFPG
jgi:hypothetical protein